LEQINDPRNTANIGQECKTVTREELDRLHEIATSGPNGIAKITDHISRLEREAAAMKPLAAFGRSFVENIFEYSDVDGSCVFDEAKDSGVIIPVEGGFNPEVHDRGDYGDDLEEGDPYYVLSPLVQAYDTATKESKHDVS
jgi:hypothetical protein